jgi:hypothetical protein
MKEWENFMKFCRPFVENSALSATFCPLSKLPSKNPLFYALFQSPPGFPGLLTAPDCLAHNPPFATPPSSVGELDLHVDALAAHIETPG